MPRISVGLRFFACLVAAPSRRILDCRAVLAYAMTPSRTARASGIESQSIFCFFNRLHKMACRLGAGFVAVLQCAAGPRLQIRGRTAGFLKPREEGFADEVRGENGPTQLFKEIVRIRGRPTFGPVGGGVGRGWVSNREKVPAG